MTQDTKKKLKCPACGANMLKVKITDLGFAIDIWNDGCGGILFDNQELNKILNSTVTVNKILSYMQNKKFDQIDADKIRVCSVCNTNMVKLGGKNINSIEYDNCNNCGAIFLDYGELEKINFN